MKTIENKSSAGPRIKHRGPRDIGRISSSVVQRQHIAQILRSNGAQAKLTIGEPNDKYEQEADRVADEVMSMPEPQTTRHDESETGQEIPHIQHEDEQSLQRQVNDEEEDETLQTKPLSDQITPLQRLEAPEEEEEMQRQTEAPEEEEIEPEEER